MKQLSYYLIILSAGLLLFSCSAPQYFHDPSSMQRQQELRNVRSGNVFSDVLLGVSSVCLAAAFDTDVDFEPQEQCFKNLNLVNTTGDTMYVNMLADVYWDDDNYCDFMDIRIPPKMTCKVMVPMDATYNLYYSTTPQSDDDELMEIFTSDVKRISLKPGMSELSQKAEE